MYINIVQNGEGENKIKYTPRIFRSLLGRADYILALQILVIRNLCAIYYLRTYCNMQTILGNPLESCKVN